MYRGLTLHARNGGDQVLISVEGEVDFATAPELETALDRAVQARPRRLVVDLRAVRFLDSSGLALLVRHDRLARETDCVLVVVKGPPNVQQVFELTGLSGRLTMVDEPPE
jgi:anti-sigma B factor antagonist